MKTQALVSRKTKSGSGHRREETGGREEYFRGRGNGRSLCPQFQEIDFCTEGLLWWGWEALMS